MKYSLPGEHAHDFIVRIFWLASANEYIQSIPFIPWLISDALLSPGNFLNFSVINIS
jgi:hypothetical protein